MAEAKFTTMICNKCGGGLFYEEKKKLWRCKYCGTYVTVPVKDPEIEGVARQILMDVANGNMEKAHQWLSECEKKDHTKVATIISRVSIALEEAMTTSGAERQKHLSDLKTYIGQFLSKYKELGPEETRLYNSFGDDSADAFAVLVYIFTFMRLEDHVKFCLQKLNAQEVRSPKMNSRLLVIAINRGDNDLITKILSNSANIDHADALRAILENVKATDAESAAAKAGYIERIADRNGVESLGARYFDSYFENNEDPTEINMEMLRIVQETELQLEAKQVFYALKGKLKDSDQFKEMLGLLYKKAVIDSDTQEILKDEMTNEEVPVEELLTLLTFMKDSGIYTAVNSKVMLSFLARKNLSGMEKCKVIAVLSAFPIDNAVRNAVLKGYLCENTVDSAEDRSMILKFLMKFAPSVIPQAMEQYVCNCTTDGSRKPEVVKAILDSGFKPSFARNLLNDYMKNCPDDKATQEKVLHVLTDAGFQIDPAALNEFISSNPQTEGEDGKQGMSQNDVLRSALGNGTNINPDTLNNYLAGLKNGETFDSELVNTLKTSTYYIKPESFCNYLLNIQDPARTQNCRDFAANVDGSLRDVRISLTYNGKSLEVNLLQAYLLVCREPYDVMNSVTQTLIRSGVNLREDIKLGGARIKFRRFIKDAGSQISPDCMRICSENRLFSLF